MKNKFDIFEEPHLNLSSNYLNEYKHLEPVSAFLKPHKKMVRDSSNESFVSMATPVTTKPIFTRDYNITKEVKL